MNDQQLPDWMAADPKLAAIFERIARALPTYRVPDGLTPYSLLESYAALRERQAPVTLMTSRAPIRDPEA